MKTRKREPSREELDDKKFRAAIDGVRFRSRIEHEANEAIICPSCGSADFRIEPKYLINIVANDLMATMVCRKCKCKLPFSTYIEEPYPEDEPEEELNDDELDELDFFVNVVYGKLGVTGIHPMAAEMIKDRIRRKLARMSEEKRFRLLAYLR